MKVFFYVAIATLVGGIVSCCLAINYGVVPLYVGLGCIVVAVVCVILAFVCALKADRCNYKPEENPPKAH
ncbi:MAG: hypothetical protein LKK13_03560 [Bacilli bacterium]|jgi:hypothetical protein|nr:hypothetical protein [Bacilli bacterium]